MADNYDRFKSAKAALKKVEGLSAPDKYDLLAKARGFLVRRLPEPVLDAFSKGSQLSSALGLDNPSTALAGAPLMGKRLLNLGDDALARTLERRMKYGIPPDEFLRPGADRPGSLLKRLFGQEGRAMKSKLLPPGKTVPQTPEQIEWLKKVNR